MRDIAYIWRKEIRKIFKDAGVMIYLFLIPFGYPFLYSLIYNPQTLRELPVIVIDDDRSEMSRKFCRMLDATSGVSVMGYCGNIDEAKDLLGKKKIHGIVRINRDFEKDIMTGRSAHILLISDMNSLLYYRTLLTAGSNVVQELNDQINEKYGFNGSVDFGDEKVTPQQHVINISVNPIKPYSESLYNPASGFATFIMPGVEVIVIQQALLLALGMMAGTALERNKNHHIFPNSRHYHNVYKIILGRTLCYFTLTLIAIFWTTVVVPKVFNFPQLGSLFDLMMFSIPYLLACIFLSMTLSCIIKEREEPLLLYVFISAPLLFLSGITWPWSSIPTFFKAIAMFFPSTFGIQGFIQIGSCGATLSDVQYYYFFEWGLAIFYFITTAFVYKRQVYIK